MPRLIGVQAAGSNYLAEAWEQGEDVRTKPAIAANTIADSISAGLPRDRIKAMHAVTETNGAYITVSDEEILAAIPLLASYCGVFAEPAGAAAYAGLLKSLEHHLIDKNDRIVVLNTGNGLKDINSAMKGVQKSGNQPHSLSPTLAAVKQALQSTHR